MPTLIFYSKPGCHLCEGLEEKLAELPIQLEKRDITQNEVWFQKYQYEVPVLCVKAEGVEAEGVEAEGERPLPRISPRASVDQVAQTIQKYVGPFYT